MSSPCSWLCFVVCGLMRSTIIKGFDCRERKREVQYGLKCRTRSSTTRCGRVKERTRQSHQLVAVLGRSDPMGTYEVQAACTLILALHAGSVARRQRVRFGRSPARSKAEDFDYRRPSSHRRISALYSVHILIMECDFGLVESAPCPVLTCNRCRSEPVPRILPSRRAIES